MKVVKFEFQNYKTLAGDHTFEPDGCSFFLVGANGKGKSSVGKVVLDLLTGNLPQEPLTEGADAGFVKVTLDNGDKIKYRFTDGKKPVIEFLTQGQEIKSPKDIFRLMAGSGMAFNIDTFLVMQPKPRREMLQKIVGVDLDTYNEREKTAEEKRKEINGRLKDQRARVEMVDFDYVKKEPINTAEVAQQLQDANKRITDRSTKKAEVENIELRVKKIHDEINEVTKKLIALGEEEKANMELKISINTWLQANPAPAESVITSLNEKIKTADDHNNKVREAKAAVKEQEQLELLQEQAIKAEQAVQDIRNEKDAAIRENPLPAEGLTFAADGEGLLLDGLPFEDAQIATSKKIIAGLQIRNKMLGTLKYLHIDGSLLDKENANRVLEYAEATGLQLCVERAIWEGGDLKMEVVDGTGN